MTDQPPPQEGEEIVWRFARAAFNDAFDGQVEKGLEKYRTYLQTFNARNAYMDALQEKADDLVYTTQLYLEAAVMASMLVEGTEIAGAVLDALDRAVQDPVPDTDYRALIAWKKKATECLQRSGLAVSTPGPAPTSSETRS